MAEKQQQLNGAYYGPSIPPPKHYHRPGRGSDCGCCCLLSLLCKVIVTLVVIIGLAGLIFWLIFRPINKVKFHVTDATLTEFNLTNNNMLHYNLSVDITIRNPNKKIGVYYDRIEPGLYYEDRRLHTTFLLSPFYQGHKNTTVLNLAFSGQQIVLGGEELAEFNQERATGVYSVDVKLHLKVRFRAGKIKTPRLKPKVECGLKLPLNGASSFQRTKCDFDF